MVTHKIKSIFLIILSIFTLLSFTTACGENDGSGYLFRYSLLGNPKTLDPQLAEDTASLIVIQNMFCGLFRITDSGKLTEGVSFSDYIISDDGLKYTFNLKNNFYWQNDDSDYKIQVTAADFVFAFQRIFDKNTKSPYSETFSCLKNAEKIIAGEMEKESVGVKANSDFQLVFELDYPNANFLSLLATSPAMPCNQEFFENAKGKYGLETEATVSNGAFYLKEWTYDPYGSNNYIIMRKNKCYTQIYTVYPSSLNFFIENNSEAIETEFINGSTDCVVSNGTNKNIFKSGYTVDEYEIMSTGLIYNLSSEIFSDIRIRQALSLSIDRTYYENKLSDSAKPAYAIVPAGITMLNKSYRELVSELDKSPYNIDEAKLKWSESLTEKGKITIEGINILVPSSFVNSDWVKYITQQWQNQLAFYCGLEVVPDADYSERIESGDYDIALYTLSYSYNSPEAALSNFKTENKNNIINYSNAALDEVIEKSGKVQNLSDCVKLYSEAEKIIIDDYVYTPLFYQKEFLSYSNTIKDIKYNPFTKQIDFSSAKKFD